MADERKIGNTTFTMPSDREVVATRVFDAPRHLIWEAHTKPEHLQQWLLGPEGWAMPICEMDLRPGGAWHFVWRGSGDEEMEMRGEFREITPPERVVYTERWGGDWPEAVDTMVLTEEDGKTTLVATVLFASQEVRDRALETGMLDGWAASYDRLDKYLPTIAESSRKLSEAA